jgi:toxin ParE1/3/4
MNYRVVFSSEAEEQLAILYRHIATAASPGVAARFTEAIVTYLHLSASWRHAR